MRRRRSSPSRLVLDGGGTLLGIPNLGDASADAVLPAHGGLPEVTVPLPPKSCTLVTRDLPLERFGLPGTLALATADLVGADATGIVLAARGTSVVAFALAQASGEPAARVGRILPAGPGVVLAELPAPQPGSPVRTVLALGQAEWEVTVWHPDDLPERRRVAAPRARRPSDAQPAVLTDGHPARPSDPQRDARRATRFLRRRSPWASTAVACTTPPTCPPPKRS